MINQQIIQKYIDESTPNMVEKSKRELLVLLNKFFSLSTYDDLHALTRKDLIQMFSQNSNMSMNTFSSQKSKICKFLRWAYEQDLCSESLITDMQSIHYADIDRTSCYDSFYFKNFNELYDTLRMVFTHSDSDDFDTFKSAVMLVWSGIPIKYLPDVLKEDLYEDSGYIIHPQTKRKLYLPEPVIKQLSLYKKTDSFSSAKFGGSVISYSESKYLFRSYKNDHLTFKQLQNLSSSANCYASDYGKTFQWDKIYLSGLYKRLLDYENQFGEIGKTNYDKLREFFGDSLSAKALSPKYKEYQEFKEYMYSSRRH